MTEPAERRLAAILSADVAGYSRLMAHDEDATIAALRDARQRVEALVAQHRGRLADFTGDNFLAEFPAALDAAQCGLAIQRALAERDDALPEARRMRFRIGAHLGDVRYQDGRLFGDGVNIAARLQPLAEPGGLCLSAAFAEQVRGKLDLALEDLGERALKNIPQPVRALRTSSRPRTSARRRGLAAALALGALLAAGATWWSTRTSPAPAAPSDARPAVAIDPSLPHLPSVAVLPFSAAGDGASLFADGVSSDLTSALARTSTLFVISRSSAQTYQGRAVAPTQIGRELGVQYLVEGEVRRAGDDVRVTAELVEAASGRHVWSETYDRKLDDLFAMQAEIAEKILGGIGASVSAAELERIRRKPTTSLNAYEAQVRGLQLFGRFRREDTREAQRLLERAIELDPNYALAITYLGVTQAAAYAELHTLDVSVLDRADALFARAIELDPSLPFPYIARGADELFRGRPDQARIWMERGRELAPSDPGPHVFLALLALQSGDVDAAWASFERGRRLNPRVPATNLYKAAQTLAALEMSRGNARAAEALWEQLRGEFPELIVPRLELAARYQRTRRRDEARVVIQEALAVNPALTTAALRQHGLFSTRRDVDALLASLQAAGLPSL